ncbi:OsmC family protein [Myxococcus sp. RHSTA-1-4]|uniref:OsmC family protein n=1 Tax=Myxococcus sp. RHSTA-1-4 TaxID=2874601 RepID=UPI001CC11FB7|nr:OsmC family protein [Myxococcus sp. RHSTA-1-4]MBZ4418611.1 OsmC family protein [Myxococcus sp. RHSTA-1-4]
MASTQELVVTLPGGRRIDARVGNHVIHTDQPASLGGEDSAPAPFDVFLAAIGTCAGVFVQGFCAKRGIPTEGIRLTQRQEYGEDGTLRAVDLDIHLPEDFPEKYRGAVVQVAEKCSVKRAIAAHPEFRVRASAG